MAKQVHKKVADETSDLSSDFVRLARLALSGRPQDVQLFLQRTLRKYQSDIPNLGESLTALLRESPTRASPLRRQAETPLPVDADSRLHLLRVEQSPQADPEPVLAIEVQEKLNQVVAERESLERLMAAGLHPTRTMLFTGPPGVGKTLTARWIAQRLHKPLLILDLAAVMSSFLGRTGNNLRHVLDYAKSVDCVLLLDELDAIAKRRDDQGEIGELKRLVTVLLQEVDDWPADGLLIAATNHSDLLDPAVWRRFEMIVGFPLPGPEELEQVIGTLLDKRVADTSGWKKILSTLLAGVSFSDVERALAQTKRAAVIQGIPLESLLDDLVRTSAAQLRRGDRTKLAALLVNSGALSQRQAHEVTGVSRDTIRKLSKRAITK